MRSFTLNRFSLALQPTTADLIGPDSVSFQLSRATHQADEDRGLEGVPRPDLDGEYSRVMPYCCRAVPPSPPLQIPCDGPAFGGRAGRVVSDHAGGFPVAGQHDFRG